MRSWRRAAQGDVTGLLAAQHEELTHRGITESDTQRKDDDGQEEEVTEELKRVTVREPARGLSSFEEDCWSWCTRPKCRMVQRASSSCSACGPVLLCHLRRGKELSPRHRRIFFSRVLIELSPARNRTCAISVRCERNCSSPSAPPAPPPLLPPSGTLPACSLRASPWMPAAVYTITHFKVLCYKIENVCYCVWFYTLYL